MTGRSKHPQRTFPHIDQEFVQMQFEQTIETLRIFCSLYIKIATVFLIANATLIGYAIYSKISGILFLGSLFPFMMFYITNMLFVVTTPLLYIVVNIEDKYGGQYMDWAGSTFLSVVTSPDYVKNLKAFSSIQEPNERIQMLRNITKPRWIITRTVFVLLGFGQVIAPVILSHYFDWQLL